jgi:hypothetical protein
MLTGLIGTRTSGQTKPVDPMQDGSLQMYVFYP